MYFVISQEGGKTFIGYVSGRNERRARAWLFNDCLTDEMMLEEVPTVTFNTSAEYLNSVCVWNLSKVSLQRIQIPNPSPDSKQIQFFKIQKMTIFNDKKFHMYRALPDGSPSLRLSRRDIDMPDVTMDCALVHASGLLEEEPVKEELKINPIP